MELSPEREQARDLFRSRVALYIAGLLTPPPVDKPMPNIGYEDEVIS